MQGKQALAQWKQMTCFSGDALRWAIFLRMSWRIRYRSPRICTCRLEKGPVSHFSYGPLECIGSSWFQPEGGMGQGNAAFLGEMLGGIDILDMERLRPPPELFAISESLYEQFRGVATVYSARVQFSGPAARSGGHEIGEANSL